MHKPPCEVEVDLSEVIRRSVDDTESESVTRHLPTLPRRGSVLPAPGDGGSLGGGGGHRSPRLGPKSPSQSPLGVADTNALLGPDFSVPGWWMCAGNSGCFLLPTVLLLGLSAGLFVPNGQPCVWWYPVVYATVAVLGPFAAWASAGLNAQRQLRRSRPPKKVMDVDISPLVSTNPDSSDSNGVQSPKATLPRNRNDPLDFLRRDLAGWASSGDGWIVIDPTGIILWVNASLAMYFGYERDYLVQRNVRILMPQPYAAEHDFFMRKQIKSGVCKMLGKPAGRPVPVVNRKGEHSVAVLSISDHLDPQDIANYVFSGRMRFGLQDAALIKVKSKVAQGCDVAVACKAMDAEPLTRIVTDSAGDILYVNAATTLLFGWSRKELVGRNVKCLMPEHHASKHDGYILAYFERTQAAEQTHRAVPSSIVGSGRDVVAFTKDQQKVRIFVTVERIDQPSGDPQDCYFHAIIVPVTEVEQPRTSSYCSAVRRSLVAASKLPPAQRPALKGVQPLPCTVVVVAVHGLCDTGRLMIQQTHDEALNLITERAQAQRGVLHSIVGDCFVLVFNHSSLPNSSHRSSAAHFLVELYEKWQYSILCRSLWLQTSAVCRRSFVAQLEAQHLLLSDSVDACFCALRAAVEAHVHGPVIDGALYQELMYSWTCRLINVATLRHFRREPSVMEMYELVEMKRMAANEEWMYQISAGDEVDPWAYWASCWEELRAPTPNFAAALLPLQSHLHFHPSDPTALWLQEVLRQESHPSVMEMAGTLPFSLLCRCGDQHVLESLASSSLARAEMTSV